MRTLNRGDTACLILDYTINNQPMIQDAYQELELQLNSQSILGSVKKLMSKDEIVWGTVTYLDDDDQEQSYTGYYALLTQEDTFKLSQGKFEIQLRVMINDEVGSSETTDFDIGRVLSNKVLDASVD